jgi:hypothetical protein
VRYSSNLETICEPISSLSTDEGVSGWPARVHDISAGGVGLSMLRRFEPGTVLLIELAADNERQSYAAPVRVVHATADGEGRWILGCKFTRKLDEEDLQALVRGAQPAE